jgi:hypothetical protein
MGGYLPRQEDEVPEGTPCGSGESCRLKRLAMWTKAGEIIMANIKHNRYLGEWDCHGLLVGIRSRPRNEIPKCLSCESRNPRNCFALIQWSVCLKDMDSECEK